MHGNFCKEASLPIPYMTSRSWRLPRLDAQREPTEIAEAFRGGEIHTALGFGKLRAQRFGHMGCKQWNGSVLDLCKPQPDKGGDLEKGLVSGARQNENASTLSKAPAFP